MAQRAILTERIMNINKIGRQYMSEKCKKQITVMLTVPRFIIGGAEQQLLELIKGLDKERFRVIVLSFHPGGDLEPQVLNLPDIEYICLNRKNKLDFSALFTVFRLLRQRRVDVIQPFLTPATFFTIVPAILNRTPVKVITERGNARRKPGLGYNLYLKTEDFFTRFADWVVPNSKSGGDYLVARGINPKNVRVIYNGINLERLNPEEAKVASIKKEMGVPEDGLVVGISASLTPTKDHATFLRAAQMVSLEYPQVRFAILGDGPLYPELAEMTEELGIKSKVSFLGNQTDVGPYISSFDIACLSSSGPEGCSNAILEAMALGKPVVATDAGGNKELVEHGKNGFIVPVGDHASLAEAIKTCISQPEMTTKMGKRGKAKIQSRFSMERMVQDYEKLYAETLNAKRNGHNPGA